MTIAFVLECLDLLPCFQPPANGAKIECFDEEGTLVHAQQHFTADLLVSKHFAVMFFHAGGEEVFGNLIGGPVCNLIACVSSFFFFIGFLALDIRHAWVQMGAVFTIGVIRWPKNGGARGRAEVGNVFVNHVQGVMENLAILGCVCQNRQVWSIGRWRGERRGIISDGVERKGGRSLGCI